MKFEQKSETEWVCGDYRIVRTESGAFDCYFKGAFIGGAIKTIWAAEDTCKAMEMIVKARGEVA